MQAHGCAAGWKRVGCLKQGLDLSRAAKKKPDAILEFRERWEAVEYEGQLRDTPLFAPRGKKGRVP